MQRQDKAWVQNTQEVVVFNGVDFNSLLVSTSLLHLNKCVFTFLTTAQGVPGEPMDTESSLQQEKKPSIDTTSLLASLGLESATSIPHMDAVEPEKLAWMQELPRSAKVPTDEIKSADAKSVNARFDLEGRVVPPEANVPMHLGLHHHGEEQEVRFCEIEACVKKFNRFIN